MDIFS